ncbi:MAG: hypothetical protein C0518_00190 [Opitutus sp.]|nr:hypothetical protein [Opitutus sp.]
MIRGFILLLSLVAAGGAAPALPVPRAALPAVTMATDGRIAPGEWGNANVGVLPCGMLMLKQVGGRVWFAFVPDATHATCVDLFLQDASGVVHNLHASLQWGERVVAGSNWTDREPATRWGEPKHWSANRIAWAPGGREQSEATKQSFLPYEAHEFAIERAAFAGKEWRVRIELRDFAGKNPDVVFPAASTRYDASGWAVWRLE